MTEKLRTIDFTKILETHNLASLYFIAPLFNARGTKIDKLLFGIRTKQNSEQVDSRIIVLEIKEALPFEYADAEITLLPNAVEELELIMNIAIRPYAYGHGGNIILDSIREEEGVVVVTLVGSCSTCPSALGTMRYGVEALLKEHLSWVKRVEATNLPEEPDFDVHW